MTVASKITWRSYQRTAKQVQGARVRLIIFQKEAPKLPWNAHRMRSFFSPHDAKRAPAVYYF
jgi:hypothetical protein